MIVYCLSVEILTSDLAHPKSCNYQQFVVTNDVRLLDNYLSHFISSHTPYDDQFKIDHRK